MGQGWGRGGEKMHIRRNTGTACTHTYIIYIYLHYTQQWCQHVWLHECTQPHSTHLWCNSLKGYFPIIRLDTSDVVWSGAVQSGHQLL